MTKISDKFKVFGIRHHGPGCAKSINNALNKIKPDLILLEGPPEAADIISFAADADMLPPVALLIYQPDTPANCVYYPFAEFSPEWQAIKYSIENNVKLKFFDLPQSCRFALSEKDEKENAESSEPAVIDEESDKTIKEETDAKAEETCESAFEEDNQYNTIYNDPIGWLASAAGFSDGERWWEHVVEQREEGEEIFHAINEAMQSLRSAWQENQKGHNDDNIDKLREAWMRKEIREAENSEYKNIAVICGAWHVPALLEMPMAKEDNALLKGLAKSKLAATWIPWTYNRLSRESGYGAGIDSPGWFEHLWQSKIEKDSSLVSIRWLTKIAELFRAEDYDVSSAHIIEAVRLSEALAALNKRPIPGLDEFNDAVMAIMTMGDRLPLNMIYDKLIVGDKMGTVPSTVPVVPLVKDLESQQKELRLKPSAVEKIHDLDLRKELDLNRSYLFHRLNMLGINWGRLTESGKRARGTFHELWEVQWRPELSVAIIEAAVWGNTVEEAAVNYALNKAKISQDISDLGRLVEQVLYADLPDAVSKIMEAIKNHSAVSNDIHKTIDTVYPLANIMKYGNVRKTDSDMVFEVLETLLARIFIGLPGACSSLDDDAAGIMFEKILSLQNSLNIIQNTEFNDTWAKTLSQLLEMTTVHGIIIGRALRILMENNILTQDEVAVRLSFALSSGNDPAKISGWIDGFLRNAGMILVYDEKIWDLIDTWVSNLPDKDFINILPMIRRTFSSFTVPERKQIGEKVKNSGSQSTGSFSSAIITEININMERGERVITILREILIAKNNNL